MCVDKSNVLQSYAFFREIFDETAARHPHLRADHCYVDAMALNLVAKPWSYDVMVTENMFGDILSDLGAALIGGMGIAPSADIGSGHALFQPCHGSAPDIIGTGRANPTAMILSAAMLLDWLGETRRVPSCVAAAAACARRSSRRSRADSSSRSSSGATRARRASPRGPPLAGGQRRAGTGERRGSG
ncbi:MAG: isocitrate/isopropylmalate family dehydrogenase [Actinomycetia bacterium]|nr:isocitrate/isopropylmalate family dehydrogenase [Actinomycetes bacterium]